MNYEKNTFEKLRTICKPVRVVAGLALISVAVITGNAWFYLGVVPLIAGTLNFCIPCAVSKQCNI